MHQFALATHYNSSNRTVAVRHQALYFELQEHHCLDPETPVSAGTDQLLDSDNILNAYFPSGIVFTHSSVIICIFADFIGTESIHTVSGQC